MRTPAEPRPSIAKAVRAAREAKGLSQRQLAQVSCVSRPTIARLELGHDISMAKLEQLAAALGLDVVLAPNRGS